jgi:hypothetical protein
MTIAAKQYPLGSIRVDSKGRATLPTLNPKKPGTYLIQLIDSSGKRYFLKIVVGKKK